MPTAADLPFCPFVSLSEPAEDLSLSLKNPCIGFGYEVVCDNGQINVSFVIRNYKEIPINSVFWNFGDDSYSFLQEPEHTYSDSGTYTVLLVVNDEISIRAEVPIDECYSGSGSSNSGGGWYYSASGEAVAVFECKDGPGLSGWEMKPPDDGRSWCGCGMVYDCCALILPVGCMGKKCFFGANGLCGLAPLPPEDPNPIVTYLHEFLADTDLDDNGAVYGFDFILENPPPALSQIPFVGREK